MAKLTGIDQATAAVPARMSTSKISSVPYATDEIAFDEKIARAIVLESRSCLAWAVLRGSPTSQRFTSMEGLSHKPSGGWWVNVKMVSAIGRKTQTRVVLPNSIERFRRS